MYFAQDIELDQTQSYRVIRVETSLGSNLAAIHIRNDTVEDVVIGSIISPARKNEVYCQHARPQAD